MDNEMREKVAHWAHLVSDGHGDEAISGMDEWRRETSPGGLEYDAAKEALRNTLDIFGLYISGENLSPEESGDAQWAFATRLTTSDMRLLAQVLMPEATRWVDEGKAKN